MKPLFTLIVASAVLCVASPADAHHGKDFLLVETAHVPEPGSAFGISRQDYISIEQTHGFEFQPVVLLGVLDWASVEVHAHIAKPQEESLTYESTAPSLHVRFTPRDAKLALGASVEYEIARKASDPNIFGAAGVIEYEIDQWHAALNVLLEKPIGSEDGARWGYAAGTRYALADEHAVGLELLGSFARDSTTELMAGYYFEASEQLTLNFGLGTGVNRGPDLSVRTALVWSFR